MTVPRSQSHTGRGSETRPTGEAFLNICVFFHCQVCPVQRARPTFPRDSRRHCTTTSPQPQPGSVHVRHFTHTHSNTCTLKNTQGRGCLSQKYTHTLTHTKKRLPLSQINTHICRNIQYISIYTHTLHTHSVLALLSFHVTPLGAAVTKQLAAWGFDSFTKRKEPVV